VNVQGSVRTGENLAAGQAVGLRIMGPRIWPAQLILGGIVFGLTYLGYWLSDERSADVPYKAWIWIGACCAGLLLYVVRSAMLGRLYYAGLAERGLDERHCAFTFTDKGVSVSCAETHSQSSWRLVSEIALEKDSWLLIGITSWFLPRRFFADAQAERTFLELALRNLSHGAVDRSQAAQDVYNGSLKPFVGYGEP